MIDHMASTRKGRIENHLGRDTYSRSKDNMSTAYLLTEELTKWYDLTVGRASDRQLLRHTYDFANNK